MSGLDAESLARLRLIRSANIGPVGYRQLIRRFGDAASTLSALPDLARRGGGKAPRIAEEADVLREAERTFALGARYIFLGDPAYPRLLAETDSAPPVLIYRGQLALFRRMGIAMVGARNASAAACRFARGLAQDLAGPETAIISGLARGIDTAAHMGAIEGGTVAVIASGVDVSFPPENAALQERIANEGLLLTEQPPGMQPLARHFPARNRIIAGASVGTVVVEAAPRSGSLITARLAAEAGREVMAVPGSPLDPRTQGCNQLIREGATLIQSAADVMEALGPIDTRMLRQETRGYLISPVVEDASDVERHAVVGLLGSAPAPVDEIIRQSALTPAIVQMVLLELELSGRLERHAGGRVSLVA